MPQMIVCVHCGHTFGVPGHTIGKQVFCPKCKSPLTVPSPTAPASDFDFALEPKRPVPAPSQRRGNWFIDLLVFRRMISPLVIQLLFWLAVVWFILSGIGIIVVGAYKADQIGAALSKDGADPQRDTRTLTVFIGFLFYGLAQMCLGPLLARFVAEIAILLFRMNETLTDIRNNTLR
jgi:hypothetical protein